MAVALCVIGFVSAARGSLAQRPPSTAGAAGLPDSCGRADPSYLRVANETGGQPLFFKRSEAGRIGQFMRELSGNNRETLLWAAGSLDSRRRRFAVPVDSTIERVTFALSVDGEGSTLTIVRPSGASVRAGDADTEITELACTRIVTVATPDAGEWQAAVTGTGRFWFQAGAKTNIFLSGVEFVQMGGRPGHEGLFRIAGQPLAGSPATLQLTLSGGVQTASFKLLTLGGETIAPEALSVVSSTDDDREYAGTFNLPRQPFRVAVSGEESGGHLYQRVFHTLFHAETVEVVLADNAIEGVPPGVTSSILFTVRNVGQPAAFRVVVADSKGFVSRADPRELTLGTGASGRVMVGLTVPPEALAGTGLDVTITATSTSGPPTTNGTVKHLSVVPAQKP